MLRHRHLSTGGGETREGSGGVSDRAGGGVHAGSTAPRPPMPPPTRTQHAGAALCGAVGCLGPGGVCCWCVSCADARQGHRRWVGAAWLQPASGLGEGRSACCEAPWRANCIIRCHRPPLLRRGTCCEPGVDVRQRLSSSQGLFECIKGTSDPLLGIVSDHRTKTLTL